jgi:hypothetical protein
VVAEARRASGKVEVQSQLVLVHQRSLLLRRKLVAVPVETKHAPLVQPRREHQIGIAERGVALLLQDARLLAPGALLQQRRRECGSARGCAVAARNLRVDIEVVCRAALFAVWPAKPRGFRGAEPLARGVQPPLASLALLVRVVQAVPFAVVHWLAVVVVGAAVDRHSFVLF